MSTILGRARVSSLEQAQNSHALEQQKARLWEAGCTEILEDVESGGSRKQLQRLIDRASRGDVIEIVATRIDRITRSLTGLQEFGRFCLDRGINLRILDQQIDLKTSHGRLMFNVLGSLAEWELDLLRERVDHGWNHLRNQRRAPGIVPFGYCRENDRYAPDMSLYRDTGKTCWAIARELVDVFLQVQTVRGTARLMNQRYGAAVKGEKEFPREIGLKYWLENPVLRGHIGYYYRSRTLNTDVIPDQHVALIDEQEYQEIKRLLDFVSTYGQRDPETWNVKPLAGLVYCDVCGGLCTAITNTKTKASGKTYQYVRWYCKGRYKPVPECDRSLASIRDEDLERQVIELLVERAEAIGQLDQTDGTEVEDTPEIKSLLITLAGLEGLGDNQALIEARQKIKSQIEALRIDLKGKAIDTAHGRDLLVSAARDVNYWLWLDPPTRRRYFKRFIGKIWLRGDTIVGIDFLV